MPEKDNDDDFGLLLYNCIILELYIYWIYLTDVLCQVI